MAASAMLRALNPVRLDGFVNAVQASASSPDAWRTAHDEVRTTLSALARARPGLAWPLDLDEVASRLKAESSPSEETLEALFKAYAGATAECVIRLREPSAFSKSLSVSDEHREFAESAGWRLLRDSLFDPHHIPDEVWFLQADPDNSYASCISDEEAGEILELDDREGLLGQLPHCPDDGLTLRSALGLAVTQRWYLWLYEVS